MIAKKNMQKKSEWLLHEAFCPNVPFLDFMVKFVYNFVIREKGE